MRKPVYMTYFTVLAIHSHKIRVHPTNEIQTWKITNAFTILDLFASVSESAISTFKACNSSITELLGFSSSQLSSQLIVGLVQN